MSKKITLINFIDLSLIEKKMILSWRNNEFIKKWMYNNKNISIKNHLDFIDSLNNQTDKLYFLVKENNSYIGVINFTDINQKSCTFGLYSNIELKGYGKVLLKTICDFAFDSLHVESLIAESFLDNSKAIYLYRKFNFLEITSFIFSL